MELDNLTIKELKELAQEKDVSLEGITKKSDIIEVLENNQDTKLKVGDMVTPLTLVDYRNHKVTQWDRMYQILEINKKGAVLGAVRDKQRPVWATFKLDNLRKV